MTRKAFITDVIAAASANIRGISKVLKGSEDGEFDFCYTPPFGKPINIHAIAQGRFSLTQVYFNSDKD